MTEIEGRPRLKPGCRLAEARDVLLIPEGVLRLRGPASRVVECCDGTKTVPQIVVTLLDQFPAADRAKVTEETAAFLLRLAERGALEFV